MKASFRRTLIGRITNHFGPDRLLIHLSLGISSILPCKEKASQYAKLTADETEVDALGNAVSILRKPIISEIDEINLDNFKYNYFKRES